MYLKTTTKMNILLAMAMKYCRNEKDKLTRQLDQFILSIRMENSTNANLYEFEDCFFLVHKIDSLLKNIS